MGDASKAAEAALSATPDDGEPVKLPSRAARKARRRRQSGRRLFAFDREIGARWVAGADEAGRGSLAGPLVAAAVLFDLERLTLSDRRALSKLNDSKQHTEAAREELYPLVLRAAARTTIVSRCVRGIDSRGLHVTNLEALRSAPCARRVRGHRLPGGRVRRAADGARAAGGDRRRLPQRRNRGGVRPRQGQPRPLHAPGGGAATRSGISRPTSATRLPSTGRPSPRTASRRCTGCPSSHRLHAASARHLDRSAQKAHSTCSSASSRPAGSTVTPIASNRSALGVRPPRGGDREPLPRQQPQPAPLGGPDRLQGRAGPRAPARDTGLHLAEDQRIRGRGRPRRSRPGASGS